MGIGYFFAKWFLVYSELKTKDAYCFVLLAFSFAAIIRFFFALITIISPIPTLLIILTLPFCSLYACRNAFNPQSGSIERRERSLSKTSSYKPAVFLIIQVLVYAAIFGNGIIFSVLQNAIPGSTHENAVTLINYALRGLFPFLLFLWIASQNESSQFRSSANTVFLVLAFVLLTAWFFDGTSMVV
ncbi:MAG: hypothetical protein RR547_00455, partial [Raoultibacter sp.]